MEGDELIVDLLQALIRLRHALEPQGFLSQSKAELT
jgi:hypothetical protein